MMHGESSIVYDVRSVTYHNFDGRLYLSEASRIRDMDDLLDRRDFVLAVC